MQLDLDLEHDGLEAESWLLNSCSYNWIKQVDNGPCGIIYKKEEVLSKASKSTCATMCEADKGLEPCVSRPRDNSVKAELEIAR